MANESEEKPDQPFGDLEVILYQPNIDGTMTIPRLPRPKPRSNLPMWERLTDHVGAVSILQRLQVQDCVRLLSGCIRSTGLEAASSLAENLSKDKDERSIEGMLLLSLCAVLEASGRASPEDIDRIIRVLTKSCKPKYLDALKRGALFLNQLIASWAEQQGGNRLRSLDQATQVVLQGV